MDLLREFRLARDILSAVERLRAAID